MNKFVDNLLNISSIEEMSRRIHWINNIHPLVKFFLTIAYIISLTSIDNYELALTILYGIYPIGVYLLADLSIKEVLPKIVLPMILGVSIGVLNPLFDTNYLQLSETIIISAGWLSFLTLALKSFWIVFAILMLVASTPIEEIAYSLTLLKVPKIICIQFLLTFRYITILIAEMDTSITAYSLRSGGKRSIGVSEWGSLVGQLFLRASTKSIRLYEAMKLRGFNGTIVVKKMNYSHKDSAYLLLWISIMCALLGVRGYI